MKEILIGIILIIVVILLIKSIWNPILDENRTGQILLWFGQPGNRKYIVLWEN